MLGLPDLKAGSGMGRTVQVVLGSLYSLSHFVCFVNDYIIAVNLSQRRT